MKRVILAIKDLIEKRSQYDTQLNENNMVKAVSFEMDTSTQMCMQIRARIIVKIGRGKIDSCGLVLLHYHFLCMLCVCHFVEALLD